nr:hypothetical protein BaRGS_002861 [Batillaria attramentaria]
MDTLNSLSFRDKLSTDDTTDNLVHNVAVHVLVAFSIIAGLHEYSGSAIDCLAASRDGTVKEHMKSHVDEFCMTQTLYYYPRFWEDQVLPTLLDMAGTGKVKAGIAGSADEELQTTEINHLLAVAFMLQIRLLHIFFKFNFVSFGSALLVAYSTDQHTPQAEDFPRVVLCRFRSPTIRKRFDSDNLIANVEVGQDEILI